MGNQLVKSVADFEKVPRRLLFQNQGGGGSEVFFPVGVRDGLVRVERVPSSPQNVTFQFRKSLLIVSH